MSQNDFVIDSQPAPASRADINSALQALASLSSGPTAPATTYANQLWYDTATNILKMRSEADDAWISIAYLDQLANAFRILDNTQVTDTSGTQKGVLSTHAQATWNAGVSTVNVLISPALLIQTLVARAADIVQATENIATGDRASDSLMLYFGGTALPGAQTAGANLRYASAAGTDSGVVPSGTWRCRGYATSGTGAAGTTLWYRVL